MTKIHTFHGGIHIEDDHKLIDPTVRSLSDAKQYIIPLQQHIGSALKPLVKKGDKVKKNQCLADSDSALTSRIHAPVSGTIIDIIQQAVIHPNNLSDTCIILANDFADQSIASHPATDYRTLERNEIQKRIADAGVIGLGGAGFPSYAKIKNNVQHLIINAAECEPYISCDDALMQNYTQEIINGIKILQQLLQPKKTIIAIEDNKSGAITAIQQACEHSPITVQTIPTLYPSGGEKQLIKILTNQNIGKKEVPSSIVCYNVNTIYSIQQAVVHQIPLTEKIVTITGKACKKPGNYLIKNGTPIAHIIEQTHISNYQQLIYGGPMMGFSFSPTQTSTTKISNCIIAADSSEVINNKEVSECIRCGRCTDVCPMELLPQQLYWHSQDLEKSAYYSIDNCIECACCDYVCPSNIPLTKYFQATKAEIREKALQTKKSNRAMQRHDQRELRLVRVEQQRQEKLAKQRAAIKEKIAQKKVAEKLENSKKETKTDDKQAIIEAAKQRTAKPNGNPS